MSGEISVFFFHEKTLAERLEEYTNILSTQEGIVPASQIRAEWVCDVELVIEPVGWQALWKISRFTCEEYEIRYPTIVLVEVLGMNFSALNAMVKIMAVQDDIHLPEKHEVPLIELYATIKQTNTSLDIIGTAHCIDRLRFFYTYLWMPWDEDEDDNKCWVEQHLEPRIRLYYDMNNGTISKQTCDVIKSLINEGREVQKKISSMEAILPDVYDEDMPEDLAEETCTFMKYHFRLQQIKAEMDLLENPSLRALLRKNQTYNKRRRINKNKDKKNINYLVWLGGTFKELQELTSKAQTLLPEDASIRICGYLDQALDTFEEGDTILLGEGRQEIKRSTELEGKGTIIGICNTENTILYPIESDMMSALFDFSGTEIFLKNICIELEGLRAGIIVRKDCTVIVTGCRIGVFNATPSSVKWGAIAMPGAKLVFEDTVFQGLGAAVIIYATGKVVMNKCRFEGCYEGIRLSDNAHFTATKTSFEGIAHGHAIVLETEKVTNSENIEVGNNSDVSFKEIFLSECKFGNDDKGSIALRSKGTAALTHRHVNTPTEQAENQTIE